ncbi:restriction endonuclease [Clostridium sp. 'White wine YQ']|uniref:restriction endonuclease n=1 Tax=Clostridium sp. 'White wine YQ' TaxID=3027474 RepID=UPI00236529B9|nr:restriction endonuclease [Clostridium sp. 'White wine YQ']MDD7795898.1 restriction endonuclease [Clostridium sp. 'White wine YQ']
MATLTFNEQERFEKLFGMSSGYVLDFSNRKFQQFIYSVMNIDIYQKYEYASKAKLLRQIILDYDNVIVGKLLMELLSYMRDNISIDDKEKKLFSSCVEIANRLMGKKITVKQSSSKVTTTKVIFNYEESLKKLVELTSIDNNQKRGFAFEKYLFELFKQNELEPRSSFRITGEQIDGSFILNKEVYLLEAKWTKSQIDKGDLVIFNEKVSSKSGFTRGLFISFSGYTSEAIETFANGRTVNIILMTVQELVILLQRKLDFKDILWRKVRFLAEEGDFFKNTIEL